MNALLEHRVTRFATRNTIAVTRWWDNFSNFWYKLGYLCNDDWFVCGDCGDDGPGFHACPGAYYPSIE